MKTICFLVLNLVTLAVAIPTCPPGWTYFQESCYRWYSGSDRLNWHSAQSFCDEQASNDCTRDCDSNLVSIHSAEENDFLLNYWRTSRGPNERFYWIGYKEKGTTNMFKWSDGSDSRYQNWDAGQPDDRGPLSFCGAMWTGPYGNPEDTGKWNDLNCERQLPFICKFSVSC